jgi:penicillin-binding protein 1A
MVPLQGLPLRILLIALIVGIASGLVALSLIPTVAGAGQAIARFDSQFLGGGTGPLRLPALPQRSTIYAADGSVLATLFEDQNRAYVPLSQVNVTTRNAVLAIEDHKFYEHGPLDVASIVRAALANLRAGHVVQGGSTITQQLIKNTETGNAETLARKFQEAQDAIRLEKTYTKDQILEIYLNEIYLGNRVYGIGTAAQFYFGARIQNLTLPQAALLAGMISSPVGFDPIAHPAAATERRNVVLADMLKYGWATRVQYDQAVASRVRLSSKGRTANTAGPEPYWVQFVVRQFLADPRFGPTLADRRHALFQGGLKIYTTLQPKLEAAAKSALHNKYPDPGVAPPNSDPEAALVTVVPQTGAIVAMANNTSFSRSQVDLGSQAERSTGSAFKAFTLAAAFEGGFTPEKTYSSTSPVTIPEAKCPNPGGPWMPNNSEGAGAGPPLTLRVATADSINVVFAQLIADVGPQAVADVAAKMGLAGYIPPVCAITLGAVKVSPLAMASAYSTLANAGKHCQPYSISRVVARTGKVIFRATPTCTQVIPAGVAATVTDLLKGVIAYGTGTAAQLPDYGSRPEAGKTGTGQSHDDAWFMGYIAQLCAGVWVGYMKGETPNYSLQLRSDTGGGFGGTAAAPIWHDFMAAAEQGLPIEQFPKPPPEKQGIVPNVVGLRLAQAVQALDQAKFTALPPTMVPSDQPAGTVVAQSPAGGSSAPLGSGVSLSVSNGHKPKPSPSPSPSASVPDVVGLSQSDAESMLSADGFRVAVEYRSVHDPSKYGMVLNQHPGGGTPEPPGFRVTIVVGRKP